MKDLNNKQNVIDSTIRKHRRVIKDLKLKHKKEIKTLKKNFKSKTKQSVSKNIESKPEDIIKIVVPSSTDDDYPPQMLYNQKSHEDTPSWSYDYDEWEEGCADMEKFCDYMDGKQKLKKKPPVLSKCWSCGVIGSKFDVKKTMEYMTKEQIEKLEPLTLESWCNICGAAMD